MDFVSFLIAAGLDFIPGLPEMGTDPRSVNITSFIPNRYMSVYWIRSPKRIPFTPAQNTLWFIPTIYNENKGSNLDAT